MPLSVIREGRPPAAAWLPSDRVLALALQRYEDSLCPGCGMEKERAWADRGDYVTEVLHCSGCEAKAREEVGDGDMVAVYDDGLESDDDRD